MFPLGVNFICVRLWAILHARQVLKPVLQLQHRCVLHFGILKFPDIKMHSACHPGACFSELRLEHSCHHLVVIANISSPTHSDVKLVAPTWPVKHQMVNLASLSSVGGVIGRFVNVGKRTPLTRRPYVVDTSISHWWFYISHLPWPFRCLCLSSQSSCPAWERSPVPLVTLHKTGP